MPLRGVRGATVAAGNNSQAILSATQELLVAMLKANPGLQPDDIGSAFFTVTDDLDSNFPALAARGIGWTQVPMLCAREIPVPTSVERVIRILLHWNTDRPQSDIQHVYLGEAAKLRPDISQL